MGMRCVWQPTNRMNMGWCELDLRRIECAPSPCALRPGKKACARRAGHGAAQRIEKFDADPAQCTEIGQAVSEARPCFARPLAFDAL